MTERPPLNETEPVNLLRLRCPKCLRKGSASRDETDPPNAVLAVIICPKCDKGDFNEPEYWDANNCWIDPSPREQSA
jgi:hypothetical protein